MKKLLILLAIITITTSCEDFFSATKEIDLGEFDGQVSVVGRLVNTDLETVEDLSTLSKLGVLVSRSRSVVDTSNFPLLKNADVRLTGSDGLDVSLNYIDETGYYLPGEPGTGEFERIVVKENTTYSLVVDIPGEDRVEAKCETKTFGNIKNINAIKEDIKDNSSVLDRLQIEVDDPAGENFYYLSVLYEFPDGRGNSYYNSGYLYSVNSLFDDSPELFTDELFDGKNEVLEFWSERYINSVNQQGEPIQPDNVIVFVWSLSKEEYEFRRSVDANYNAQDNPFAEPSIVFSNIENGVGVFSMSRIERFVIPWE